MATIEQVVRKAADDGARITVRAVRELEDGSEEVVEAVVDAAGLVARAGERTISVVVRDLARALGGARVRVSRVLN